MRYHAKILRDSFFIRILHNHGKKTEMKIWIYTVIYFDERNFNSVKQSSVFERGLHCHTL